MTSARAAGPAPDDTPPAVDEIVPDTKDWTWVVDAECPECGFDGSAVAASDVAPMIRDNATAWRALVDDVLAAGRADDFRRRSRPDRWSGLEYAAHVRDVYRLYLERLRLMLHVDDPLFPNWDQDASAVEDRYAEQDPDTVADQIVADARDLADAFDAVAGDVWDRVGRRSDGAAFTVATFARYLVHDPIHHLWDVRAG